MKLADLVDLLNLDMRLFRTVNANWGISLEKCEIKSGSILGAVVGFGATVDEALNHMVSRMAGQLLVIDAFKDSRNEYRISKNLEL